MKCINSKSQLPAIMTTGFDNVVLTICFHLQFKWYQLITILHFLQLQLKNKPKQCLTDAALKL